MITISITDIKRKCMVAETCQTYDAAIQALITEMQPALEHAIAPEYLQEDSGAGLQATLKLGMTEMLCGEFLAQRAREPGATEDFQVGQLRLGACLERGKALREQGSARLAPYLRQSPQAEDALTLASAPEELTFTPETMRGW